VNQGVWQLQVRKWGLGGEEVQSGKVEVSSAIPHQEQDAGSCCNSKTLTSVTVCWIFDISKKHIQFDLIFDALFDR